MFLKIVCLFSITCLAACDRRAVSPGLEVREYLEASGVFSKTPCSPTYELGCVSLEGLRKKTVEGVIALKRACQLCGAFRITSGTEPGHVPGSRHNKGMAIDFVEAAPQNLEKMLSGLAMPDGNVYKFTIGEHRYRLSKEGLMSVHWHMEVE